MDGRWHHPVDWSALYPSAWIMMRRVCQWEEIAQAEEIEVLLLRHMVHQTNEDGGFYKYPSGPSSIPLTRLATIVICCAIGLSGSSANQQIDQVTLTKLRACLSSAETFLDSKRRVLAFDPAISPICTLLIKRFFHRKYRFPIAVLWPSIVLGFFYSPMLDARLNPLTKKILLGMSVLYQTVQNRDGVRGISNLLRRHLIFVQWKDRQRAEMIRLIRQYQNENGGWCCDSLITIISMVALTDLGVPPSDLSIQRGGNFLRQSLFRVDDAGLYLAMGRNDLWSTSVVLHAFLMDEDTVRLKGCLIPAVEFLLKEQADDGSFAFASGSQKDGDNDSTCTVLTALSVVRKHLSDSLKQKTDVAIEKGLKFLLPRQNRHGGFSAWGDSRCSNGMRKFGIIKQIFLDPATPDVTARVLFMMAELGFNHRDERVRQMLRFILKSQNPNGTWWSRWLAGYIFGTNFVLQALVSLRIHRCHGLSDADPLIMEAQEAGLRAIAFLIKHQNPDGGWGETSLADKSPDYVNKGPSHPMQTGSTIFALLNWGISIDSPVIVRGLEFLMNVMSREGTLEDNQPIFTIFAGYLYYTFPLAAEVVSLHAMIRYLQLCRESCQ